MFLREAPENFGYFWLICKAKSLMFWREAPKKFGTFKKIITLAGKISKKITLAGRFQNFGCRPSLRGGYNSNPPVPPARRNLYQNPNPMAVKREHSHIIVLILYFSEHKLIILRSENTLCQFWHSLEHRN